ncbi:MAG: hypothetical protein GC191_18395 [Azospirillum sp.]|nr:hypothetical protein [Azospirillum sp.]
MALLFLCAGLWAVFGIYRVTVTGQGLLLAEDGQFNDIVAPRAGWVDYMSPVGAEVQPGELLVKLEAPEAAKPLERAIGQLRLLEQQRRETERRHAERLSKESAARAQLERRTSVQEQQIAAELLRLSAQELAGTATQAELADGKARLAALQAAAGAGRGDLLRAESALKDMGRAYQDELAAFDRQIQAGELAVQDAQLALDQVTQIFAHDSGRVVVSAVPKNAMVVAGQRILSLELGGPGMQALIYVPADEGKNIQAGMSALVSPTTARREEYGSLVGRVIWVSPLAQSEMEIATALSNRDLARRFTLRGAPVAVVIALVPDPDTGNGYRWTSARGSEVRMTTGTVANAWVTVRSAPPILLILPALRTLFGV